ncbi:valine--tRNA ligase [Candidatus Woesearchaeota archaeon]|nr:valine--tRNA ligase [Candidatus Woesearchaeota archaeon]
MELPKDYNAAEAEAKWQKYWEEHNIYKFDPESKKPVYSIDVPPPYASAGHLHIGHALHYTQFEIIARYRRMAGYNVYFAPCFDNNGLPTEKYVEDKFKISKKDTTKSDFRKLCREESSKVEKEYADRVFKTLGHSYDWSLQYTTIDPQAQKVAQKSFIELVKKGEAYRSEEPTLWCPKHQTALAQAEIEDVQRTTKLNYLYFDLENGGKIEVATTRPEFLPSCVGIFIHPKDTRYKHLVSQKAIVPLFKQKVPIMEDEDVDMSFGTGIVMLCLFGDSSDVSWWKKYSLPLKKILTEDGRMNKECGPYQGLTIKEAQEQIIQELDSQGYLIKQEPLQQTVGGCWRCSTPVEFIVTKQWFIKTLIHKEKMIHQGRKINWYPEFYRKRYEDWTNNLAWDWCISRQRFYGVPIPVWYCKKCGTAMLPDEKDLPIDPEHDRPKHKCSCGSEEFTADPDVFDTWMTSSMSPEIAVRWLEKSERFKKMFPTSLRPQSHDIIRTWAFYTILKALLHFNEIPWKDIAIGTFVLDSKGRGMHKSKGNAIWTHELLSKYNIDVVRYWVGTATFGEDLPFQEKDLITGQKFQNKLWNASKFVISHLQDYDCKKPKHLENMDRWLLSKLQEIVQQTTEAYQEYRTGEAKRLVEQFFWHTFCDNYLEISKDRLYNKELHGKEPRHSAQYTLYTAMLSILKMFAPIMPHITEELYSHYFKDKEGKKSIHVSDWPEHDKSLEDKKIEALGDKAVGIISKVRQYKTQNNKSMKTPVKLILDDPELGQVLADLKSVTNATEIIFGKTLEISF